MRPDRKAIVKAAARRAAASLDSLLEKSAHCSDGFRRQLREDCLEHFIERAVDEVFRHGAGAPSDN